MSSLYIRDVDASARAGPATRRRAAVRRLHLVGQLKWWFTFGIAHEVSAVAGTASVSAPSLSAQGAMLAGAVPGVAETVTPPSGEAPQASRRPHLDALEASRLSAVVRWN